MKKYHPLLVSLHWFMAVLIIMSLVFGKFVLGNISNADPAKLQPLMGHMAFGITMGVLLIIRFVTRQVTKKPPHAITKNAVLDKIGAATHLIFYLLLAIMVTSGIGMAMNDNLFPIVFGGVGELPQEFAAMPATVHGITSTLLVALVLLHVAAALYHQFVLRDSLFRRMWFGKRQDNAQ